MSHPLRTLGAALALSAALSLGLAPTASARPDPGDTPRPVVRDSCVLERIATQFVRCDILTGNGVAAPRWIPEQAAPGTLP